MQKKHDVRIAEQTAVVMLAAGKGTRMGNKDIAKACFEIDGTPAICRLIETFKLLGFKKFFIVVGAAAEQVMATVVQKHPEAIFVYQKPQLGTGHAAKFAAEALAAVDHNGPVLVTMADKYIEPQAIEMLIEGSLKQQADMALLTIPKASKGDAAGARTLIDPSGQAIAIIEQADLSRQAIADDLRKIISRTEFVEAGKILEIIHNHIESESKIEKAVGELAGLAQKSKAVKSEQIRQIIDSAKYRTTIAGKNYTADEIEKLATQLNPSLYLFTAEAFYHGLSMLDNNNAQQEYYLTDIVEHLGSQLDDSGDRKYRIRAIKAPSGELIQGFNRPDELLAIQDYIRRKKLQKPAASAKIVHKPALTKAQIASVSEWISRLENPPAGLKKWMQHTYGPDKTLHNEKCKEFKKTLTCFAKKFGCDKQVIIVRAPGRVNLMGRHVDHRGGFNNFLAFHRETIMVASMRDDDRVIAVSTEPDKFVPVDFGIAELIGRFAWSDWNSFINSDWVRNLLGASAGSWGNYIKAAMLRLQHSYNDLKIHGMDIAVRGSVPMAAGLSSSSTLVVATLAAAIGLNGLELTSRQIVDMCGEGEWFVGSRGGAGDHAAIYLGKRGKIAQVGYLPFRVEKIIDMPADYNVIIANSHIKAAKSSTARNEFNTRIACYNLGLALFKQRCPQIAKTAEYVRDLNPQKLGCRLSEFYAMLMKIPQYMTRREFVESLSGEHRELMEINFATHKDPQNYPVRGVLLFGAAECIRSKICMDILAAGDMRSFGELMKVSHDGDRVSVKSADGKYIPQLTDCSDTALSALIGDLQSEDAVRVRRAQLYLQPGCYSCGLEQLDRMVDISCAVPGVIGAQVAGAGLGGCIMIVAHKDATPKVHKALIKDYYQPADLEPEIIDCTTVEGAGLVTA